jgi:conjugative transposon TraM protein
MSTTNKKSQDLKKYVIFALMGIICAGCIWFIFAPSADEKAKQEAQAGFNTDIPMPKDEGLVEDKRDAYEQEQMKKKQEERMHSLQDFSSLLGDSQNSQNSQNSQKPADDLALLDSEPAKTGTGGTGRTGGAQNSSQSSIQNSARAYQDINRTLGNFYETPKTDPEKEKLQQELEELRKRMDEKDNDKKSIDEQMAVMERSYQMASRYLPAGTPATAMPGMPGTGAATGTGTATANAEPQPSQPAGKTAIIPVGNVNAKTVSILRKEMSSLEIMEAFEKPRNMGFLTATSESVTGQRNTISACVHDNQTVRDGQSVQLRLLEPMQVGTTVIPRNTVIVGMAKIYGERLGITVNSLECRGTIIPVELTAYDYDGQHGIFIPNLQEVTAAKEVLANMGSSAGTSISLSSDAGEQFVADMGRNLVQGVSQFTSKKLREVKVRLKTGYKVFLLSEKQLKNS